MQQRSSDQPLRWGIAGAGAIARRFCQDVNGHASGSRVVAIAARDQARAQAFAAWLQHEVAGLTPYFVGQAASNRRDDLNQAEALLRGSGGLDCITLHHE